MQALEFRSSGGQKYRVNLPAPLEGMQSAFLFSFHKSGSTLMDGMIRVYCKSFNIPTFSLFNAAFDSGIPTGEVGEDAAVCFSGHGRIYTGFRHFPNFELDLTGVKSILLVRDPRDMLVSWYYSVTLSHVAPRKHRKFLEKRTQASLMSIDEFALDKARIYRNSFRKYQRMLPAETLNSYRYEDVIYKKSEWLQDLVTKLELPQDRQLIRKTAEKFDIFPENENQDKHIRQVHPGNYKNKLKTESIRKLNEELGEFLRFYNYL